MTRHTGLLFDKDGTLFDFTGTWAPWSARLLAELADGDAALADMLGRQCGFDMETMTFAPNSIIVAHTTAEISQQLHLHLPDMEVEEILGRMRSAAQHVVLDPATPLVPLFKNLKSRGLKLGVATNDEESLARANLSAAKIDMFFDYVAGCDSGHGGKPDPGMLLAFADAMKISPETVVMIGDSPHDLVSGRAAGMVTVGVLTGLFDTAELSRYTDVVLPDIGHLPAWLDGQDIPL